MSMENPLMQYFRRPGLYLKLPSGVGFYTPDIIEYPENGELPIYPMSAIDEITSRTPDALFNGTAIVELMKSCVPAIKNPWAITNIDLDAILIAIRAASDGTELEIDSICPECTTESKYGVNLVNILASFKPGKYNEELKANELIIKFRPLTYKEVNETAAKQFEIQKVFAMIDTIEDPQQKANKTQEALQTISLATIEVVAETIEYIRTPEIVVSEKEYIVDFLKNCDRKVYEKIKARNLELRQSTEIQPLNMTCPSCQHKYTQPFTLNISDFFG